VEGALPQPRIAELMRSRFVGLASDIDDPEPEVLDLAMQHLQDAMMLPFVLITDADGNYLAGSHGAVHPDRLLETLQALAKR
jgi:hypothetical protein